jgi:hypothetical protein
MNHRHRRLITRKWTYWASETAVPRQDYGWPGSCLVSSGWE